MNSDLIYTKFLKDALPADLPHVAYVTLWYPVFTQPFIFREVEGLARHLPLKVYTLYGQNLRHCSSEMLEKSIPAKNYGIRGFLEATRAIFGEIIKNPLLVWRIFKKNCIRRWNSWESFGENLWAFGIGMALGRKFREDGIDFVYAPWPRGAATASLIGAKLAGLPYAIAVRGDNLEPADPDLPEKMANACFVRANNAADQKRIEEFAAASLNYKSILVYNSLTLPSSKEKCSRFSDSTLKLLALGRFDVTKGFNYLLKSCRILKKRNIDFSLTLAGGGGKWMGLGNLEKELLKLRKSLDLEKEVNMPGIISHDELPTLLAAHDIFVAPCVIDVSGKRDGIPNTVIEAMAAAMPVVATNINALPEVVRNKQTGLLVPEKNPVVLADALIWLRDHPEKAIQMGEAGSVLARKMFNSENNAKLLANIIKEKSCAA